MSMLEISLSLGSNGLEAFEKVRDCFELGYMFQIILMDMNMPGFNGWDGCSMIREYERRHHLPKTYICLISADIPEESLLVEYELDNFIHKPLTIEKLIHLIEIRREKISETKTQ